MEPQFYLFVKFLAGWQETQERECMLKVCFGSVYVAKQGLVASYFSSKFAMQNAQESSLFQVNENPSEQTAEISLIAVTKLHVFNKNNKTEGTI